MSLWLRSRVTLSSCDGLRNRLRGLYHSGTATAKIAHIAKKSTCRGIELGRVESRRTQRLLTTAH